MQFGSFDAAIQEGSDIFQIFFLDNSGHFWVGKKAQAPLSLLKHKHDDRRHGRLGKVQIPWPVLQGAKL